ELSVHVFPKNRETYTYNTSTYMSMILSYTRENPSQIKRFILENTATLALLDLWRYRRSYCSARFCRHYSYAARQVYETIRS
ncbi:hypothetical protein M1512_01455, partial [Patescibacteria group bacterium]|nr:hypothetical protein [Patescibacteria group bacterium]